MCLVFVVDDEHPIRELVMDIVEEMGCTVYGASTGIDALALIDEYGKPDLVITDLMMPLMSGQELYDYLHGDAEMAEVPMIIMTATSTKNLHFEGEWPPILFKPFNLELMEETVINVLGEKDGHNFPHAA